MQTPGEQLPFMHASANTPAGAASASIALFPAATGLPLFRAGSTPTLPVSGPARRSLTFRPACSLNRLSRSFCQSASIHVVTSMNRPDCYQPETIVAGRDSHPLERGAFHGARGSRARAAQRKKKTDPRPTQGRGASRQRSEQAKRQSIACRTATTSGSPGPRTRACESEPISANADPSKQTINPPASSETTSSRYPTGTGRDTTAQWTLHPGRTAWQPHTRK